MQPATDALKDALRAGRPQIGLWSMLSGPVAAEVVFASKMGADPAKVRQALMGGFAASRVLEVHGERMIARTFEPGFRVELHQKDLNLALSNARQVGVSLPNTATAVETWDLTASPIDMLVGFSNEQDGRAAAEHLLARRRQRLALVMADDQRSLLRRRGFTAALRERGLEVAGEVIVRAPSTLGAARDALARLVAQDAAIDGVFCSSDQLALGVLYEASARAIAVPERLAVVGFGDLSASAHSYPSLTTVAVDGDRVGREAARLILERLARKAAKPKPAARVVDVGSRVIARESA